MNQYFKQSESPFKDKYKSIRKVDSDKVLGLKIDKFHHSCLKQAGSETINGKNSKNQEKVN